MTQWNAVLFADASELAVLAGIEKEALPQGDVSPEDYFAELRSAGERISCVSVLASALPREEAIAWAGACLSPLAENDNYPPERRHLLEIALRWIGEPSDAFRRSAFAEAEKADGDTPEKLLNHAIFFSGGSIADPDLDEVRTDPTITGHLVAGAIQSAAVLNRDEADAFLDKALDLGEKVAQSGMDAISIK
jgi:Family of unknown function (DUF6931)